MIGVGTSIAGPVVDPYYESNAESTMQSLASPRGISYRAELYLGGSQLIE